MRPLAATLGLSEGLQVGFAKSCLETGLPLWGTGCSPGPLVRHLRWPRSRVGQVDAWWDRGARKGASTMPMTGRQTTAC